MPRQPLSYTNRQNSTAYIRAVPAKRGELRYYLTKDPKAQDLIEELPEGFEFYEYIHDGRIVFRKRKTSQIRPAERRIVEDAVARPRILSSRRRKRKSWCTFRSSQPSNTMDNIQSEKHHRLALSRVWELMKNSTRTQAESEEMDMLVTLVEAYESVHIPMQPGDPIAFLRYKMERENLLQQDLIPYIGDKTKVSKILNRKQELTVAMIQRLSKGLNIPVSFLIPA